MAVSIEELEKAVKTLDEVLLMEFSTVVRDATIQRFEFCMELSWKTSKKSMGTTTSAPKQVIREMAQAGLIDDVEKWFEALEARNLSSHTYDQVLAQKVYEAIKRFSPEFHNLLSKLKTT